MSANYYTPEQLRSRKWTPTTGAWHRHPEFGEMHLDRLTAVERAIDAAAARSQEVLEELAALTGESWGVAGYHPNGDLLNWGGLRDCGFHALADLIEEAHGEQS